MPFTASKPLANRSASGGYILTRPVITELSVRTGGLKPYCSDVLLKSLERFAARTLCSKANLSQSDELGGDGCQLAWPRTSKYGIW